MLQSQKYLRIQNEHVRINIRHVKSVKKTKEKYFDQCRT